MCHTFLEIPKKGFFMKLCSAHFALMINLLRKIQGPALELPQRGRARVDPFYGAPEAPLGHPPSLLTVQDHQSCMGHGSAGWAPWHTACPTHLLCMADRRRGEETDDLWFGVALISSGKGAGQQRNPKGTSIEDKMESLTGKRGDQVLGGNSHVCPESNRHLALAWTNSSSKTNLDQISSPESRPSINFKINTKILTKCRFRITTKIQLHNLYKTSATKYWPNSSLTRPRVNCAEVCNPQATTV